MLYGPRRLSSDCVVHVALLAQAQEAGESRSNSSRDGPRVANRSALDTAVPWTCVSASNCRMSALPSHQALALRCRRSTSRDRTADGTDSILRDLRGSHPIRRWCCQRQRRSGFARQCQWHGRPRLLCRGPQHDSCRALQSIEVPPTRVSSVRVRCIAGVLNLRLREAPKAATRRSATAGASRATKRRPPPDDRFPGAVLTPHGQRRASQRDVSDGETLVASLWKGLSLGDPASFTLAGVQGSGAHGARGWDQRVSIRCCRQCVRSARSDVVASTPGMRAGAEQKTLFVNAGYDFASGAHMYGWASGRTATFSPGFYARRRSLEPQCDRVYPDGFLRSSRPSPDYSARTACAGSSAIGQWILAGYGKNKMEFTIENTLNRSLASTARPCSIRRLRLLAAVLNVSGVRSVAMSRSPRRSTGDRHRSTPGEYSIFAASRTRIATAACCSTVRRLRRAPRCSRVSARMRQ